MALTQVESSVSSETKQLVVPPSRSVKRRRLDQPRFAHLPATRSRIFAPYRTVGLVSPTGVRFDCAAQGDASVQITTSVGRCLHTYDLRKGLQLRFITRPETPGNISAILAWKNLHLAAWQSDEDISRKGLWVFKRGKKILEMDVHDVPGNEFITRLIGFGSWIVASTNSTLEVWRSPALEKYASLALPYSVKGAIEFSGGICAMPTFINKVLAGKRDGGVDIWNVSTGKLIYTILPSIPDSGPVTTMEPTPALSLLAIAYESGPIVIVDVKSDQKILKINSNQTSGPVHSISFRTDGLGAGPDGRKDGIMATASLASGDVTFWDLNDGVRKAGVLRGAHLPPHSSVSVGGGVSKIEILAGQAVMVTTGLDNSLKTWIFDEKLHSAVPRPLHSRSGQSGTMSCLEFLPTDSEGADFSSKWILCASKDRSLWGWSLRKDAQSTEISQGKITKLAKKFGKFNISAQNPGQIFEDLKAAPITCLACSLNRDGGMGAMPGSQEIWTMNYGTLPKGHEDSSHTITGWESIITAHENDPFARTWFWGRKCAGRWKFRTSDGSPVSTVGISRCGTFALIGSSQGTIDVHNLQSGLHRQRFSHAENRLPGPKDSKSRKATEKKSQSLQPRRADSQPTSAVTGIALDSLNKVLISAGRDGNLRFWDFKSGQVTHQIKLSGILFMRVHEDSELAAVACEDSRIRLIDLATFRVVREFPSVGLVKTMCFSSDVRCILAGCDDAVVRVWDLATSHMIDGMRLSHPLTAMAFSPSGEFLVTAKENSLGVDVWVNHTMFSREFPTKHISEREIPFVKGPTQSAEVVSDLTDPVEIETEGLGSGIKPLTDDARAIESTSVDQISEGLVTLSLVPKPRWQTLLHLNLIRARNKPKMPPLPPERAPFFLPSLNTSGSENGVVSFSRIIGQKSLPEPEQKALKAYQQNDPIFKFEALLHQYMSPSAEHNSAQAALLNFMSSLSPSAADLAISSMPSDHPYTQLNGFLRFLKSVLSSQLNFDLVLVWLRVFLGYFQEVFASSEDGPEKHELVSALEDCRKAVRADQERLTGMIGFCSGVCNWIRLGY